MSAFLKITIYTTFQSIVCPSREFWFLRNEPIQRRKRLVYLVMLSLLALLLLLLYAGFNIELWEIGSKTSAHILEP